jgi:hypothetical protein
MTTDLLVTRSPDTRALEPGTAQRARSRPGWAEIGLAALGFAVLCLVVATKAPKILEPDDDAYLASIVALSQGHLLLTTAQYHALSRQLGFGGHSIVQWVQLKNGDWISQKNPGYPFAAVAFDLLGILRLTPLFYGALACVGLFVGGRRWLGRYGGAFAVLLYCTSGAAITFAWRATMPTFTDASLIATGAGLLLWAMLASDASRSLRTLSGLGAFIALEAATFIRYTDFLELVVAATAVVVLARPARLAWQSLAWWFSSVALFVVGILVFDAAVYGSPLATGYTTGQITFSLSALGPNLEHMPIRLLESMPMVVPALVAIAWIGGRLAARHPAAAVGGARRTDAAVMAVLGLGWLTIWGLYLAYTWTVNQFSVDPVHVVRFYLPALGLIALLGAWTVVHIPRGAALASMAVVLGLGIVSFSSMAADAAPGGPGGGPGGSPGGATGLHAGRGAGHLPEGPQREGTRPAGPPGDSRAPGA